MRVIGDAIHFNGYIVGRVADLPMSVRDDFAAACDGIILIDEDRWENITKHALALLKEKSIAGLVRMSDIASALDEAWEDIG